MGRGRSPLSGRDRRAERRARVADEAARILAADGASDLNAARRKAAARLGIADADSQPDRAELEAALAAHRRLFGAAGAAAALAHQRGVALEAMRFLAPFAPRLVGPVLDGSASAHAPVTLLLHHDDEAAIIERLSAHGISAELTARRLCWRRGESHQHPALTFIADGVALELLLLPADRLRQAPLDAEGRPLARAGIAALEALLRAGC